MVLTSISKIVMVIRIILDRKDLTDDFIWILPDETGLFTGQRHDRRLIPLNAIVSKSSGLVSTRWTRRTRTQDTGIGMTQADIVKT